MFETSDVPAQSLHSTAAPQPTRRAPGLPVLALSLIVFVGLASGCQTPYESGISELNSGQYAIAEQHAKRGLDEDPEDPELNLLLARALVAQKNYRDAEAYAEVAFRSGDLPVESGRTLGKIQWELGRAMDAAQSWQSARAAKADSVSDTDYQRALESALRTASSIQNFEKSLKFRLALAELTPTHPEATPERILKNRQQLAAQARRIGNYEESIKVYETLLEDAPEEAAYLQAMAQILETLERFDDSKTYYDRYIQLAPDDASRISRMVEVSQSATSPEVVQHYMRQAYEAMEGTPSTERAILALRLAGVRFEDNNEQEAKRYLEQYLDDMETLNQDTANVEVYFRASDVASQHARPKYALELLARGQAKAPSNWRLTERLAGLYTRRARSAEVERVLNAFVDASKEPFEARLLVARWANARRNYDLAQHFMERAVEDKDTDAVDSGIWLELARIYAAQGRTDRLKVAITNYLKPDTHSAYQLIAAAQIYLQARLYKESEEVLLFAQRKKPKDISILDELARLYQEWGHPERIEPYYDRWLAAGGNKAEDYTMIGQRFMRRQKENQAIPYFRKGAQAGDAGAWLQIASIFRQQRRNIDMREALQKYIDASGQDSASALRTAQSYYQSAGMTNDEIAVLETLLPREDTHTSFNDHTRLGELYISQGREDAAITMWVQYLSEGPNAKERLAEAANWFDRYADPEWVLDVYTQFFDPENPNPIIYKLVGNTYLALAERNRYSQNAADRGVASDELVRAHHYYRLYLRHASPSRTELVDFATAMNRKAEWAIAADAYELLLKDQSDKAPLWLDYGEALLKTGQAQEGTRILKRYADQRKKSLKDIQKVADALNRAQLYREAEPYFEELFGSDSASKQQYIYAFRQLAQIYQATLRTEQIPQLAKRYLERSQNPTEARQEVHSILNNAGMYTQAAEQIEQIRSYQGNVLGRELAQNWFRAGEFEKAYETFKDGAEADAYPGEAWVSVAQFYADHARPERATQAFESAVSAAPESASVHMNFALFLLRQGDLDRGLEVLEAARRYVTDGQRDQMEYATAVALQEIGHYDMAAEIARAALERNTHGLKDDFTLMLSRYQLATQTPDQAKRTVDALKKSGAPLRDRIQLLLDFGYEEEAAQWLESALTKSDYYTANQVLQSRSTLLSAVGGFERLENALKPLLERTDESANTNATLGYMLMNQGQYTRAIPYLKVAETHNFPQASALLADAYASLGLHDLALRQYRKTIANTPPGELSFMLSKIGAQLELGGQDAAYIRLLQSLTHNGRYASIVTPLLVKSLIQAGEIDQAFDLIYQTSPAANEGADARPGELSLNLERDADIANLVGVFKALAEEGYLAEARAMLARLPEQLSAEMLQDPRLQRLSLHLLAAAPADLEAFSDLLDEDGAPSRERSLLALHSARVLMMNGHYDAAESVARDALLNAHGRTQNSLGDFLLGNILATGDLERLDAMIDTITAASGNKLEARKRIAMRLSTLGQDARALTLSLAVAEEQPTTENIQRALVLAQAADDMDAVQETTAWLIRVDKNASRVLENVIAPHPYQQRAGLSRSVYAPLQASDPAALSTRFFNIFVDFRAGEVERARAQIAEYLQAVDFDPYAVQLLLERLDEQQLYGESARVVAPQLEGHRITALSHRHIGIALRHIGDKEAAEASLATYIEMSPDAARAAGKVASLFLGAKRFEDARTYAEQAIQAQPSFLTPYYIRGITRLVAGEVEAAKADLEKSIGTGVGRFNGLYNAAFYALKAGHDEAALEYIEALLHSPMLAMNYPGPHLAIQAFVDADRATMGVEFIEAHYPKIAAGVGNLGESMLSTTSTLYSAAGRSERAHQLYETGVTRQLAVDPLGERTITYMNNLAYGYASEDTPDKALLAKGFELSHRAIAGSQSRSSSYLDTLGWLYFRQNNLDQAEPYIRGSLRTTRTSEAGLGELIDHVIALEEARGNPDEASWLRVYRQTLR